MEGRRLRLRSYRNEQEMIQEVTSQTPARMTAAPRHNLFSIRQHNEVHFTNPAIT